MSIQTHAGRGDDAFAAVSRVLFGVALTGAIGIGLSNLVGPIAGSEEGIAFLMRRVLRLVIVLLGLQLTVAQVGELGFGALALVAASLVSTLVAIRLAGRLLGVERGLTELIAAGTSIWGPRP